MHGEEVNLTVGDLNAPELPTERFDMIYANGVLHHIANLEACADALYRALLPGGALFANEFTGPRRYGYSLQEVDLINAGIALLPEDLRQPFEPSSLWAKLDADPSEAVRTRDMEKVLCDRFDEVEAIPYGGNILMRALRERFFENFDPKNQAHIEGIARLVDYDADISAQHPSHHVYFVAWRKGGNGPRRAQGDVSRFAALEELAQREELMCQYWSKDAELQNLRRSLGEQLANNEKLLDRCAQYEAVVERLTEKAEQRMRLIDQLLPQILRRSPRATT
jgi:hypothetical protein